MTNKPLHPDTIAARADGAFDRATAGVVPAIHPATTFMRDADNEPMVPGNTYARDHSDNLRLAENVIARLEGAEAALLFPSGMAAVAALCRPLRRGACVIVQTGNYWGCAKWITDFCDRREIALHGVEASDAAALEQMVAKVRPDLVFLETPSNPWLRSVDIAAAARAVHGVGGLLAIDGTAATPVLTRALDFGADIVMHSATKGLNGHSDVLAGVLATRDPGSEHWQDIMVDRQTAGAILGPFEAWLLLRGMRTLPLRVERMSANALALAQILKAHPSVEDVFYPGLPHHPGHSVARMQMQGGYGSLLSVLIRGGRAAALRTSGRLQLFHRATSLGGVESLVEHRHTIEPHTGIPENLLRLSVGIEHIDDLIADFEQALR